MALILTVANEKGGVSKTTTAVQTALAAIYDGLRVLIVDVDHQQSATKFSMRREEVSGDYPALRVIPIIGMSVYSQIRHLSADYDLIIVDSAGRDSPEMRAAMATSHIVIIPTTSNAEDTDGLNKMAKMVSDCQKENRTLRPWLLLANTRPGQISAERDQLRLDLTRPVSHDDPAPLDAVLPTIMRAHTVRRKAYSEAYAWGRAVREMMKPDPKASSEVESIYQEIRAHA
jgi:chromosome partitioning protein